MRFEKRFVLEKGRLTHPRQKTMVGLCEISPDRLVGLRCKHDSLGQFRLDSDALVDEFVVGRVVCFGQPKFFDGLSQKHKKRPHVWPLDGFGRFWTSKTVQNRPDLGTDTILSCKETRVGRNVPRALRKSIAFYL